MGEKIGTGIKPDTPEFARFDVAYSQQSTAASHQGRGSLRMSLARHGLGADGAIQHGTVIEARPMLMLERPRQARGMATIDAAFPQPSARWTLDLSAIDEGAADLLYGLVRAFRPTVALETGTHRGRSTKAIAAALERNDRGHIWTVDAVDYDIFNSGAFTPEESTRVTQVLGTTPEVFQEEPLASLAGIDFAFLDGAHHEAGLLHDLEYVEVHADDDCLVVIDNAADYGWPEIEALFRHYDRHPHICVGTMCGMEIITLRRPPAAE